MEIKTASFVTSLAAYHEQPPITLRQLAVVGKSNVGKSSLINALCNRKKLCKTSATPGKTLSLTTVKHSSTPFPTLP